MMDNKSFDEHVKEQLSGYTPEVPAHIWENIMARKQRKKPGGWLFFLKGPGMFVLVALLLSGGAAVYFLDNNNSTPVAQTNNSNTSLTTRTNTNQTNSSINSSSVTGINNPEKTIQDNLNDAPASSPSLKGNQETGRILNDKENKAGSYKKDKSISGKSGIAVVSSSTEYVNEQDFSLTPAYSEIGKLQAVFSNPGFKKTWIPSLPIPCPGAEDNAAGNKRYVEIYAGADHAFRSFTDTGNSGYLQTRKQTTSTSLSFSAGLRYTRVFNNGMSIRTGLNYSQINEKFTYTNGHVVQVVYIMNSNGDTTGSYVQSGTRYKSSMNKYRSIDIPLLIGYEFGNGRIHANINAGPIINVYSWQKGSLLDTSGSVIDITTGKAESPYHFRKNLGVGFMGAVSAYYKLNDRFHILAEPYFRYNFSPVNKPEMTFKQKYNTAGIRLGLRMDF